MTSSSFARRISAVALVSFAVLGSVAFADDDSIAPKKDWKSEVLQATPDILRAYGEYQIRKSVDLSATSSSTSVREGMMGAFGLPASGLMGNGLYGMSEDARKPITPLVLKGEDPLKGIRDKIEAADRELIAQEDRTDMLSFDIKDRRSDLKKSVDEIAAAKAAGKSTLELEATLARDKAEMEQFRLAYLEARKAKTDTMRRLGTLEKQLRTEEGKSQGWVLSDSAEEKELAVKEGFKCAEGERMTSKPGFGLSNWACLNSKGLITKQATRNLGMPQYDLDVTYERNGDDLAKVVSKTRDGKLALEQIYGKNEQTTKMYSGNSLTSSCTSYGDPYSFTGGGLIGPSGTKR